MEDLYGGGLISLCLFLLESKTPRETDQNLLREYSISSETVFYYCYYHIDEKSSTT